jgi:hypothetical protein
MVHHPDDDDAAITMTTNQGNRGSPSNSTMKDPTPTIQFNATTTSNKQQGSKSGARRTGDRRQGGGEGQTERQ